VDFWNGTLPEIHCWQHFKESDLEPYYQLFSKEDIFSLKEINIKSFLLNENIPETRIIFFILDSNIDFDLLDSKFKSFITDNLNEIKDQNITNYKIYTLNFEKIISKIIHENNINNEIYAALNISISNAITYKIQEILNEEDFCINNAQQIKIYLKNTNNLDSDLLEFQLKKLLNSILGKYITEFSIEKNVTTC